MYYDGSNCVNEKEDGVKYWECKCGQVMVTNFCGNCGIPRPAEKRKLWKLLSQYSNWQLPELSKIVIDEICEEIDKFTDGEIPTEANGARSALKNLKQHLKETLL